MSSARVPNTKQNRAKKEGSSPGLSSTGGSVISSCLGRGIGSKIAFLLVVLLVSVFSVHFVSQLVESGGVPDGGEKHVVGFFGQQLHIYCTFAEGGDKDVLIFHHDFFGSSADWYPLQHQLKSNGISSCSYDRPGFGLSPPPQTHNPSTIKENNVNLHQLLQKVLPQQNVKIINVGHSLGSAFALGYSLAHPTTTKATIVIDPFLSLPPPAVLNALKSKVGYYEVLTRSGFSRLIAKLQEQLGSFLFDIPVNRVRLLLRDEPISTIKWEVSSIPDIFSDLKQLQAENVVDLPLLWIESTAPLDTFYVFDKESLSYRSILTEKNTFPSLQHKVIPSGCLSSSPCWDQYIKDTLIDYLK